MACRPITDVTGRAIGLACGRTSTLPQPCQVPDCTNTTSKLCDWPDMEAGRTCDMRLCDAHAFNVAREVDYCPEHAAERARRRALNPEHGGTA
jgi:hypothetical protein